MATMTMPSRTGHRPLLAPLLAALLALLLLAGCSGGSSDPAGGEGGPTDAASESADPGDDDPDASDSPAEPEPTADIAAVENLNPCESLTPQEWRPFLTKIQRESATLHLELTSVITMPDALGALIQDDTPKYACVVSYRDEDGDEASAVAWGYFLGKFGPDNVNRILASSGGTATDRGYAAITATDILSVNGYGYHPNEEVGFWVMDKDNAARRFNELDPAQRKRTSDRVLAVLDTLSLERDEQPRVLLPEACPRPDDQQVREVIGKVGTARGADDGAGKIQCLYRNPDRDRTLRLTAGAIPQEQADALVADAAKPGQRKNTFPVDEGDAGIAIAVPGSGSATSALVHSEELRAAFAAVEIGNLGVRAPDVPRSAVITLLKSFDASTTAHPSGG